MDMIGAMKAAESIGPSLSALATSIAHVEELLSRQVAMTCDIRVGDSAGDEICTTCVQPLAYHRVLAWQDDRTMSLTKVGPE